MAELSVDGTGTGTGALVSRLRTALAGVGGQRGASAANSSESKYAAGRPRRAKITRKFAASATRRRR